MKFRTVPVTFPCLLNHLEAVMQSKSRLYFSAIWFKQLCSTNSAQEKALPGPQTYPSVYWPSVPFLYLDTVKLLQAKFTLNIVPLSTVSEITPSVNLISCRVFGDQRHSMGQGLPSWIFVQMPSERCSHSTAFSCHTLFCMTLAVCGVKPLPLSPSLPLPPPDPKRV